MAVTTTSLRWPTCQSGLSKASAIFRVQSSYAKSDYLSIVWYNGHEIVRHYGQFVSVNAELLNSFCASIDQSKTMFFARLELEFRETCIVRARGPISDERAIVVHFPIDQVINGLGRDFAEISTHNLFDKMIVFFMKVVCEQDGTEVFVVLHVRWTVNDHWAYQTTSILCAVMGVVPGTAVQIRFELVPKALAGSDRTLLDCWNAVHPRAVSLQQAMPVKSSSFFRSSDLVMEIDDDGVSPIGFNSRSRKLVIDE